MDLLELRKEIDEIDDELIPLLLKRMSVSKKWQSIRLNAVCLF